MEYIYRLHAMERMFQRDISVRQVEDVVQKGEVIESYMDDKPYASYLAVGYFDDIVLHVVYAKDEGENIIIITTYEPSLQKWENNFRTRKV